MANVPPGDTSLLVLHMQSMPVYTGSGDEEGRLVLVDGRLVAVLVRLADKAAHGVMVGAWFLEAGFGPCASVAAPPVFDTLDAAQAWVKRQLEA